MPLARIITSTPALAKDVSRALKSSGYIVEIVPPTAIPATAADLEIDLDLQNGIAWRPESLPVPNTFEPNYDDDVPIEREFVLAPLWRKFTSHLRDRWQTVRPKRKELVDVNLNAGAIEESHEPMQQQAPQVIEMPKPERQKRPSVLTTTLSRWRNRLGANIAKAQLAASVTAANLRSNAALRSSQVKARVDQLRKTFSSRKRQPVHPVAVTQVIGTAQLTQVIGTAKRKSTRDYYLVRQLWPVAAGVVLAFLLGWTAATYNSIPARQLTPQKNLAGGGVTVFSRPMAKALAPRKPTLGTPLAQKPSASRRVIRNPDQADVAQDEVVVRHYPARAASAKNQTLGTKHYSDLE